MSDAPATAGPQDVFCSTRWTVIVAAGGVSSPESENALSQLCQTYWYPLYAYVRRQGHSKEDAEDLTQSFFERFLQKNSLQGLSSERGRFRAYLLACFKHFLANEWDKSMRQKRGGGVEHLSLDWQLGEERYQIEPVENTTPETLYDRAWAMALLERVLERLSLEYSTRENGLFYHQARQFLMPTGAEPPLGTAARAAGMEEGAFRVALHRLRKRYRETLREEIAQTLASPATLASELQSLQHALAT